MLTKPTPEDIDIIFAEAVRIIAKAEFRLPKDVVTIGVSDETPPHLVKNFQKTMPIPTATIHDSVMTGPLQELNTMLTALDASFTASQQRQIRQYLSYQLARQSLCEYAAVFGDSKKISSLSPAFYYLSGAADNVNIRTVNNEGRLKFEERIADAKRSGSKGKSVLDIIVPPMPTQAEIIQLFPARN